ncbi:MAG: hypothetical protein WC906_00600 [Parcubacteria group bacterium]|jgi:CheY-like chemotaxis protein
MKILVVEDRRENIEAAKNQLGEHELTIISGYDQAHELIQATVDLDELGQFLAEILPNEWKAAEKVEYEDGGGMWYLSSPEGKTTYYWEAPKDVEKAYAAAEKKATHAPFDVVLTDVMFAKGGDECMSASGRELARRQGEMPYGPIVALRALQAGVRKVGILTQGKHHDDPFVFAFDSLYGFQMGDVKVVCSNRMQTEDRVKDWKQLLARLMDEDN